MQNPSYLFLGLKAEKGSKREKGTRSLFSLSAPLPYYSFRVVEI